MNNPKDGTLRFILFAIGAIVFLRMMTLGLWPLVEPSEARYSAISAYMAMSSDSFAPWIWIDGALVPFLGKPPLFFWTQSLSISFFGCNEFAARLPCLFYATLTVLSMIAILRKPLGELTASLAALITLSCGVFLFMAGSVAVDMALVFGVTLAYCCYFRWLKADSKREYCLSSLGVFFGFIIAFLSKGLLPMVLIGLPVFIYHILFGGWKDVLCRHTWILGIFLMVLICGSWLVTMDFYSQAQTPPTNFFHHFFMEEHVNRFLCSDYSDPYGTGKVQPRGMSVVFMILSTLPWILVPIGVAIAYFRHRAGPLPRTRFHNLCWYDKEHAFFFIVAVSGVFFFAVARQILITYMLPLIPAFAIWVAMLWTQRYHERGVIPLTKAALLCVILYALTIVVMAPFFDQLFPKMSVKSFVAEIQKNFKDYRLRVLVPNRFYSPYFYDYDHVISPYPLSSDSCMIFDNHSKRVTLPCRQKMPHRLPYGSVDWTRELYEYHPKSYPNDLILMTREMGEFFLPSADSPKLYDVNYFRIQKPTTDTGFYLYDYCDSPHATYECVLKNSRYLLIRPIHIPPRKKTKTLNFFAPK